MSSAAGEQRNQPDVEREKTRRIQKRPDASGSRTRYPGKPAARTPLGEGPRWSAVTALVLSGLVAIALLAASVFLLRWLGDVSPEASLSLIFVSAAVVLILVVSTLAIVLRRLGLADRNEAMGLPSGTIRAIIALLLVMLFFIAAIFLFNSSLNQTDPRQTRPLEGITAERFATIPTEQIQSSQPRQVGNATVYDVVLFQPHAGTAASEDIAKQLITTVGTLVTAVAAFYFGASSVMGARKEGSEKRDPGDDPDATDEDDNQGGDGLPTGGIAKHEEVQKTTQTDTPVPPSAVENLPKEPDTP